MLETLSAILPAIIFVVITIVPVSATLLIPHPATFSQYPVSVFSSQPLSSHWSTAPVLAFLHPNTITGVIVRSDFIIVIIRVARDLPSHNQPMSTHRLGINYQNL